MHYIVLDLEWNQCPGGKDKENPRLPFEVIEIGAVRVSSSFKIQARFSERIKPQVYHQLYYRTKKLLKVNMKDFASCRTFPSVIRDFLAWCGHDYTFVTWGPMDLDCLQNNMDFYGIHNILARPLLYYDAQKLFSLIYEDGKSRRSLKYAVEDQAITIDQPFHHAVDDAYYTAEVFIRMDPEQSLPYLSVDYHNPPSKRSEEIDLHFPDYSKFVSLRHDCKDDIMHDKQIIATPCHICGRLLRRRIMWFTTNNSLYYCLAQCPEHGFMQGKIRIKKASDGSFYAVRTTKMISEEKAEAIRGRQDQLRQKRRIRRSRPHEISYTPIEGTPGISVSPDAASKKRQ
ncbi:MAG: exonuclease domain-containing protein [Lachnospiraceae bacterium]